MSSSAPQASEPVDLKGSLEKVVFHNEENGYTVFRFQADQKADLYTVVGHLLSPQAGSRLHLTGHWSNHAKFGRQIVMDWSEEERPAELEGIRLFLASGCVKGIGPFKAAKIVRQFGVKTLDILDDEPDRLLEVPGFGPKTVERIKDSWAAQQGVRELMIFLQPHGLGSATIVKIFRAYGQEALAVIKENPYRLAMDVQGIGFATADNLARNLGFAKDSLIRAEAGLLYILLEISDQGHIFYPLHELLEKTGRELDIGEEILVQALEMLEREERIVIENLGEFRGVYLARQHHYETRISFYLHRLLASPASVRLDDKERTVREVIEGLGIGLAEEQKEAVRLSTTSKIMVLTGGPGTGKTTIINAIIQVFARYQAKILLAAPTGRAAKRMAETSGREAMTIHRLLEYSPQEDSFMRNENRPLACGLLVVDEASMIDTMLMYHLLKAVPLGTSLVLVGDVNQLPSVGPGNVLRDIIASGSVQVVELLEVFRQAAESDITCNAHLINRGQMPVLRQNMNQKTDFYFFRQDDPEQAAELIVDLVKNRIRNRFGFQPGDIQVLSPMLKGAAGVNNLNKRLQESINPNRRSLVRGERKFFLGDRVMQIRNNYDKDIFNGDIGNITWLDEDERELSVTVDDRVIPYCWDELDEIVPAYAISIHKAQGGEYPVVIIPLLMQHYVLLQRNLVYTAVTRGKNLVVLVGEIKALATAINNNRIRQRHTWLAYRLAGPDGVLRSHMLPRISKENFYDQE